MMSVSLFYGLSAFVLFFSACVLFARNPIISALSLATSMLGLASLFFALGAYFIAAVQVTVYAGAVMVLFVIVIMLFDLKKEIQEPSTTWIRFFKLLFVGIFLGFFFGVITLSGLESSNQLYVSDPASVTSTKDLAHTLFNYYLFAFEVLGILLLVVAIGVVSVSRIQGGTHAQS